MIFFVSTSTGKLFNQIDNFNANYLINIKKFIIFVMHVFSHLLFSKIKQIKIANHNIFDKVAKLPLFNCIPEQKFVTMVECYASLISVQ